MDETVPKDKTVKSTPADLRSLLTNFDEVGRGADVSEICGTEGYPHATLRAAVAHMPLEVR